jgi:hypothetical protein
MDMIFFALLLKNINVFLQKNNCIFSQVVDIEINN